MGNGRLPRCCICDRALSVIQYYYYCCFLLLLLFRSQPQVIIFNRDQNSFVFVKQFRPPVYVHKMLGGEENLIAEDGVTIELCAGIIDKTRVRKSFCVPRNYRVIEFL